MFDRLFRWLNDLNPRQLLVLAGVVMVLMFSAVYVFLSWWTDREVVEKNTPEPVTPPVEMRTVVTAKTDIPPLTVIKAEMLQTKEVAADLVPQDAITDVAEVLNIPSKSEIFADDVITARKLSTDLKQMTFVGAIPPDCRAVSISVNEVTSVDGFAKPGDKVDLLLVETDAERSATTSMLLQDVLLLSINKNMQKSETATAEGGTATTSAIENPTTATFALHPGEVLKLISATKLGEIYLILRPANPTEKYFDSIGYTINSINAANQYQAPAPQPVTPAPAPVIQAAPVESPKIEVKTDPNKFEIIQGDKIVQEK